MNHIVAAERRCGGLRQRHNDTSGRMIELIRGFFRRREYEYSLHALDQSVLRRISTREVEEAVEAGEIIEDYPADKYGPSCLIFGFTADRRPLHVQCNLSGAHSGQSDNLVSA